MRAATALGLRASRVFQMQAAKTLRFQASPAQMLRRTQPMRMPVPEHDQTAHTISQRLRKLKRIPVELLPLAFVMAVAIAAACYSLINKLFSDKTLRLTRSGKKPKEDH